MNKLVTTFFVVLGCAVAAWAEPPATLTSLRAIHALSHQDAAMKQPVAFEATVTYYRGREMMMFVQDDGVGIYVRSPIDANLVPGDRVLVKGTTWDSFRVFVMCNTVILLHHGAVPKPIPTDFDELIHVRRDCLVIKVRAVIRAADPASGADGPTFLQMLTSKGYIGAVLDSDDASARKQLLDADVEVTGVATANLDGKLQETGVRLYVPSLRNIRVIARAGVNPQSLPITPMDEIFTGYQAHELTSRTKVRGIITYYQPGSAAVLESGARSVWVETHANSPLRVGDLADATGFPTLHDGFLSLARGEIQDSGVQTTVRPEIFTWEQLSSSGHIFDLVSIEGQVVTEIREASQDEYVLVSGGDLFTAIYPHPNDPGQRQLSPMEMIPPGAKVRVTGICVLKGSNPYNGPVPFDILLRSFADIVVVSRPSLLNVRNLMLLVGLMVVIIVGVSARGWMIESRVRRQTATLAYVEQRRSRILEDINGSRPLAEIVEQIAELVSFKLHGAPCWCQITDGPKLGNCPAKLAGLRIAQLDIPARSGPPPGTVFAAFDRLAKSSGNESQTLSMAVGLTALAIETRHLYSDLVHRSEFDLLTDIDNRFSLDKHLELQVRKAREAAGIFGLIYIDLDRFKQVNDSYGHHVGDLYLQEAAIRMKRQLRPHDKLARLGGDEFAAMVPVARSRADVEEIARRLERCFDDPFVLDGYTLHGAASVGIALFPEDATTVDALLSAADTAMYVGKYGKRYNEEMVASRQGTTLSSHDGESA